MKNSIKETLKQFSDWEDNQKLLDLAINDGIDEKKEIHPARVASLHPLYAMEGGTLERPKHLRSFDEGFSPSEKELLNEDISKLAKLSSMAYNPSFILEKPEKKEVDSDDRFLARDVLMHLMEQYDLGQIEEEAKKEVLTPIMHKLEDILFDKDALHNALLPSVMTKKTQHDAKDYSRLFQALFLTPAVNGEYAGSWGKMIRDVLRTREN